MVEIGCSTILWLAVFQVGQKVLGGLTLCYLLESFKIGKCAVLSEININSCYDTIRCLLLKIMKWFQWLCDIPWNEQNW